MVAEDEQESSKTRYFTKEEVAEHNCAEDCWVSFLGVVCDLTSLLAANMGPLSSPIIEASGIDISFWFDAKTGDCRTHIDEEKNLREYYTPMGRFIHIPPAKPTSDWCTDIAVPWWKDPAYRIGVLSKKTRKINIVNTLTQHEHELVVPVEETVGEIQERYLSFNGHARSYTWKRLTEDGEKFVVMDMDKTLEENGVKDEDAEFDNLQIESDLFIPCIHILFNDDLSIA
jgi:hypothetical protein